MDKHKYAAYCRQAVEEGCVLLENDGTLPFLKNARSSSVISFSPGR